MAGANWRDVRPGTVVDSGRSAGAAARLAVWRGPLGWARVALHLAGLGARDMRRAAAVEALALFDRVCRLAVLAGLGWGLFVLAEGRFDGPVFPADGDVSAWQALAWAPALIAGGVVGMGLVLALRPVTSRPEWD